MARFESCIGCTDRAVGCHGKCPKYLADKAENDKKLEIIAKARKADRDAGSFKLNSRSASLKRKQ